jgi:regulator of replication initiation timing
MASKAIGFLNFKFGADLGGFERAMNKAQKKLKKFGKGVERTGKSLTTGLTLPIVALGAASLKTFADFEQGMLKVKAISGATDVEFKALTESAKELGSTTMFTASQVAELQLNLSKLGLTPTQINQSTESILNLAQATDSDLGQAATVTAKIMNAFGMEATDMTRITDVMADAFSSTALDMTKFETAMASVAPVAKMAGSDLEQTSAVLGVLVNNGVEASTAGTALRNIFLDLSKSGKTWDEAMGEINSSTNPLAVSMEMFGKRGANVATILAQSGVEIESLTQDFRDSTGEAKKMADIMDSGVAGSIRKMRSQLEGAAIELGEKLVPIFEIAIEKISKMVKWFTSLSDEQQKNIVKYGLIIAAIGPLLIIIGKMSIGLSALIPIFIKVGTFLLANPYILLAAAIAAVAYAIYDFTSALNLQIDVQKELGDLNNKAQKSISKDLSNIDLLTTAIKDENTSLEDKKRLLNELKSTYPGYYDEIDETSLSTKELNAATLTLTKSLMQTARLTAYKDKLTEINKKMIELENRDGVDLSTNLITEGGLLVVLGPLGKIIGDATGATEKLKNTIQEKIDTNEYEELSKLQQKLTDETIELEKEVNKTSASIKKLSHNTENLNEDLEDGDDIINLTANSLKKLEPILLKIKNAEESLPKAVEFFDIKPVEAYRVALGTLVDQISVLTNISAPELEDALMSTMTKLGDNLAQGAESFQEFGESVKGMMRDIIGGIISQGIATAITAALSSPAIKINPFLIPVIAGAAAGLARTAFNSLIPAFAEGGLVTGPTTALIGEGVGTNAGNPEVVAPLDKLKSMMGGGNNSNITVTGKLIGSDIFLSNQNASNNRLRTT